MKKGQWQQRFGAARLKKDRALLAEVERAIDVSVEESVETVARKLAAQKMGLQKDVTGARLPEDLWKQTAAEARERLYRAFGRPVS